MRVCLYSELQKWIEKSGVGRARYHQIAALQSQQIDVTEKPEDADIVHINTVFPKSYFLARKAQKQNIPVIYHAHSTREDFRNSYIGSNVLDGIFGKWITLCYNTADLIITPSEYAKERLMSYGIRRPVEVISNGIDLKYYDKKLVKQGAFRNRFGYKKSDKIIMSVGLTIERKGIMDFVELARRLPQYQFIWFGETNLKTVPKKIRKAVETKLPNLRFAGYAAKDVLREAYADCDLFLFASKEETEGIVVLEALAMEIPVLLRDIPVYQGWLKDGREVYKADSVDRFEILTRDILEYRKPSLAEYGYKAAEKRSLDRIGIQLLQVYQKALRMCAEKGTALEITRSWKGVL